MPLPTNPIVSACQAIAQRSDLAIADLMAVVRGLHLSDETIAALQHPDPSQPYGRRVLLETPQLEVMVATWTPGMPCAPHDHGGQRGVVLVLRGASMHRMWQFHDGQAQCTGEHTAQCGDVLVVAPETVHSMESADPSTPLITLHLYTQTIPHMVVYDLPNNQTLLVSGNCGAWVPSMSSGLLLHRRDGLWGRAAFNDWLAEQPDSAPAVD